MWGVGKDQTIPKRGDATHKHSLTKEAVCGNSPVGNLARSLRWPDAISLMYAGGTLEGGPPFTAHALNQARSNQLRQLQSRDRYTRVIDAGFQCIQLKPLCSANAGFDLHAHWPHCPWSGDPRVSSPEGGGRARSEEHTSTPVTS